MVQITIVTEAELRACVQLDLDAVEVIADAFTALAVDDVVMPPILRLDIAAQNGELDVKTAYVPGLKSFAVKMSSGFFDNPGRGLSSLGGLMVLFSAETGKVEAVLLDNGYLTDVRTAAAGAVAARYLARDDAATAGVIGAGVQARLQMEALSLVRDIERILVWARVPDRAEAYAAEMSAKLAIPVSAVESAESVVRESDIVVTTTSAKAPIVQVEWLHPGLHLTAMGSDAEDKNELHPQILSTADTYVCDRRAQCLRLGELHHAVAGGAVKESAAALELGQITSGAESGRPNQDAITVCDLTGTGVQDAAIALFAFQRAMALGFGTQIEA